MSRNIIMIAVIVVIVGYFYFRSVDKQHQVITSEPTKQQIETAEDTTKEESADQILVENLFKEGIIARIEDDSNMPNVYVTADYERIPEVDKNAIMEVLYKYFTAKNPDVVSFTLYDIKSGDEIGAYKDNQFNEK